MLWIIGYGNSQRRDDGLGPYVIRRLRALVGDVRGIKLVERHQLEPDLVEEMREADTVIFVDASAEDLDKGWVWREVAPDLVALHHLSHQWKPPFLLGLTEACFGRSPRAWTLAVQGEDFGLGEGLSAEAEERAQEALQVLLEFVEVRVARSRASEAEPSFSCATGRTDIRVMVNPQREGGAHGCRG